jgi:hypothetical protein
VIWAAYTNDLGENNGTISHAAFSKVFGWENVTTTVSTVCFGHVKTMCN